MKDISVYSLLDLSPNQIYIVGRPSKKYQNQCQVNFDSSLSSIQFPPLLEKNDQVFSTSIMTKDLLTKFNQW